MALDYGSDALVQLVVGGIAGLVVDIAVLLVSIGAGTERSRTSPAGRPALHPDAVPRIAPEIAEADQVTQVVDAADIADIAERPSPA